MTIFMFANNVDTTLAGPISSTATSLTLASAAFLPTSIPAGQTLVITLNDQATRQNFEIIYATSISGATLSGLLRGQEGTSALSWSTGDFAYSAPTAGQQGNFGQLPQSNQWTGSNTFTKPILAAAGQLSGIVGASAHAKMNVTSAGFTSSWSADEVVLEDVLGGLRYCIASASASINLAATGAGGMDAGSPPASGFVAIYGIYDPATATFSLLATNATSTVAPNIYAGGHMPSGYTASALLAVWPTDASGHFVIGNLRGRRLSISAGTVLSTNSASGTYIGFPLSAFVPPNAISVSGVMSINNTTNSAMSLNIAADTSGVGQQVVSGLVSTNNALSNNFDIDLETQQNLYFNAVSQTGTPTITVYISSYTI